MLELVLIVGPPLVIGYLLIRTALRLIRWVLGWLWQAPARPLADDEIVIAVRRLR